VSRDFTESGGVNDQPDGHGTGSATVLIGQGQDGIRGMAPRATLCVGKVTDVRGVALPGVVADGIDWLISCGTQIIVLPLGDSSEWEVISRQIERATTAGAVLFAAAGNGFPFPVAFPARHPLAIAVGSAERSGKVLTECSLSPRVDLLAPGNQIPTFHRNRLQFRRGTSIASVIAAGTAVLAAASGSPGHIDRRTILEILTTERCS
jgi:subtilisin family serine protease